MITKKIVASILGMGLAACATHGINPSSSTTLERRVNEPIPDFGRRICKEAGEGVHRFVPDANNETAQYQVTCEEHGGIDVLEINNFSVHERMDYPVPEKLTKETLKEYVADKAVVMFGNQHDETYDEKRMPGREQSRRFRDNLSTLKETGFTTVTLEIIYPYQGIVDAYVEGKMNREDLLKTLAYHPHANEEIVEVLDEAKTLGMRVICLDNRDAKRKVERDEYMAERVEELLRKGERIASLVGSAHVRNARTSEFQIPSEEIIPGFPNVGTQITIKPLARRLIEVYGEERIGRVDLIGCYDSYIETCVE